MPTYKVNIKWGKEKFSDVECNTDEPPEVFKAQLFALSGVQPDRQKVMLKGMVVKDDSWGNAKLKDGAMVLMMGSADALPEAPKEKVMFMEDMSEQQLATAMKLPAGLTNLGNTCYMNATIQCLKSIPELKDGLKRFNSGSGVGADAGGSADLITASMKELFLSMDKSGTAIPPIIMLQVLHMAYPQFAEKSEHGGYAQQDANECWTELVRCLQQKVPGVKKEQMEISASSSQGLVDQYLSGEFDVSYLLMICVN